MINQVPDNLIGPVLAEVVRGGIVESQHRGHMVLLGADGSVHLSRGNPSLLVYPRSSIKSIQAAAMVRAGMKLQPRLLALVAASHSGSEMHQSAAREILALASLDESALQNAKDRPLGEDDRIKWGSKPSTSLAQNCSGKHAGMLFTSVANGWLIDSYLHPEHPVQVACRAELETLAGEEVSSVSVDGCGAPLFLISLMGLARAIHNLTISTDPIHQSVIHACRDFPEMVAGEGRLTTRKMREIPGLFLKEGAEGVQIASLPDGRAMAVKVEDGSARALGVLLVAALEAFGVVSSPESTPIFGGDKVVGSIRANL
ncbi:MAG: asparaginase [Candidatus Nanopelagicaceae bacterium]